MQGYNVLMVYNTTMDQLLLCKRRKNPYKGLSNLVGGKIESGETGQAAAYRELYEETRIAKNDVTLHHVMDFTYYLHDYYIEVYAGRLKRDVPVAGDENDLYWTDLDRDFFDMTLFAGEGNIGHMIEQVKLFRDKLLAD
jgi:8-oxo-dGTP diphosphatase